MPLEKSLTDKEIGNIDHIIRIRSQDSVRAANPFDLERNVRNEVFEKYKDLEANKKKTVTLYVEKVFRERQKDFTDSIHSRKVDPGSHGNMRRKGENDAKYTSTKEGDLHAIRVDGKNVNVSPTPQSKQAVSLLNVVESSGFTGDTILYTEKPARDIPETIFTEGPMTNSSVIPAPESRRKHSETELTPAVVDKWSKKKRTDFSSQNKLFNISAREHVKSIPVLNGFPNVKNKETNVELRKWEWLHLIAFSMGGSSSSDSPQKADNIVAGTYACNSNMLCLESALKKFVKKHDATVMITVDAELHAFSHVAKSIVYRAFYMNKDGTKREYNLTFNNFTHYDPPPHSQAAIEKALDEAFLKPSSKATTLPKISPAPDTKSNYTPPLTSSGYVVSNAFSPSKIKLAPITPAKPPASK